MKLIGAPIVSSGVPGVVSSEVEIGTATRYVVQTHSYKLTLERHSFELLPPAEAESYGLTLVRRKDSMEGRLIECTGNGAPHHRPWRTVWFPLSTARTLCALCPACGTYYLGDQ